MLMPHTANSTQYARKHKIVLFEVQSPL